MTRKSIYQAFQDYHVEGSKFLKWYLRQEKGKPTIKPVFAAAIQTALQRIKKASVSELSGKRGERPSIFFATVMHDFMRPAETAQIGGPTAQEIKVNRIRAQAEALAKLHRDYMRMTTAADRLRELADEHPELFDLSADPPRMLR